MLLLDYGTANEAGVPCADREGKGAETRASFFDIDTRQVVKVSPGPRVWGFGSTGLRDGSVLIAGGASFEVSEGSTSEAYLWDPRGKDWRKASSMHIARAGLTLVTLQDGRVLAVGGWVDDPECEACIKDTSATEIYDPTLDRWTPGPPVPLEIPGPDGGGEDEISSVIGLGDGRVLAVGANASAALYDPGGATWTALAAGWQGGYSEPIALRNGSVLSFGSDWDQETDTQVPYAIVIDPLNGTRMVGHFAPPDSAATAVLGDGRVLFAGGVVEDGGGYLGDFQSRTSIFDPLSETWTEAARMPSARAASTALALGDGSVLVVGGVDAWEEGDDRPPCVPRRYRVVQWSP